MQPRFAIERFVDIEKEIDRLVPEHWAEVGSLADRFRRVVNWPAYEKLEAEDRLLTLTARDGTRLVGYVVGVIGLDLHRVTNDSPSLRVAAFSALVNYLQPPYRGYARSMTLAVEREVLARTKRVTTISYRTKKANRAGAFFTAMGYSEMETTHTKIVSPGNSGVAVDDARSPATVA
jgi:hypothetical protein